MSPTPDPRAGRAPQVLVLDDDPAIVKVVSAALAGVGLGTRGVGSLKDLEGALAAGIPDLILLDIGLPDGDGFEACRRLRAHLPTAQVPIIFLTRREEVESRLRAFQSGAQDYVIKPFSVEELTARVQAHLRIKLRRDEKEAQVADLDLRARLQTDLVDMVIHDIRAPLSSVKMSLSVLAQEGAISAAEHHKLFNMANDAMDAALLMLNDLLDLRAGRVSTELAPLLPERVLSRAITILGAKAAKRAIAVTSETRPAGARVVSDEKMLLRVLLNLLGNAIKFSPEASAISLVLSHREGRLRLEVADRGPGVPAEDRERIFEKFERAGEAALSAPGTGIGLAFCRLAAGSLGGRVWVEDRPQGGSIFVFEVPAETAPEENQARELLGTEEIGEYRAECAAQLGALASGLAEGKPISPELLGSIRVTAHRLAGSAGTYGYAEAGQVAAGLERRVGEAAKAALPPPDAAEVLLAVRRLRRALSLPD
ncbi:MAG: ATP-binding protein [Elusimicrobia bacterium]|nr:ATP-binding protein [Elusimicrobiota bacterium]